MLSRENQHCTVLNDATTQATPPQRQPHTTDHKRVQGVENSPPSPYKTDDDDDDHNHDDGADDSTTNPGDLIIGQMICSYNLK